MYQSYINPNNLISNEILFNEISNEIFLDCSGHKVTVKVRITDESKMQYEDAITRQYRGSRVKVDRPEKSAAGTARVTSGTRNCQHLLLAELISRTTFI